MFFDKDDEDQDFLNPGGSKLGALFGMDKAGNQGGNESLTYTAPKQPKKKESTPPAKGAPAVAFAVAVHAYKYVDGKYASQGKLGAAILANHSSSEYSILMYVSQQQKVTTAKITSAFSYTCQANNYANFYDDVRQSWSVLFDKEQSATDFAKHICLAKALSGGLAPSSLVSQDLVDGEGGQIETGDSVEVKYTGWLLTNNTFGQVFDSNAKADKLFRFKLGAGKVIKGWDTGVIGMKKGGKRFMVVPTALAYGSQGMANRIPSNATLLFEIEVVRVKLVGRESSPAPAQPSAQAPPTTEQTPPISTQGGGTGDADGFDDDEHTVKERTRSINDQLSHSPPADTSKAKLISRMAKMGKPMLPMSGAVAAGPDSDDEIHVESPAPVQQQAPKEVQRSDPQPVSMGALPVASQPQQLQQQPVYQVTSVQNPMSSQPAFLQNLPGAQQMAVYQPQQNYMQQQQQQQQQQQAVNMMQGGYQSQIYGNQPQQAVPGSTLPPYLVSGMSQGTDMMLLSETRQQNTELRLTLSKVSDKVDTVLQKIEQGPGSGTAMLPNMETSVLLHNITRVIQENERLKKDVFDKSAKIESQNEKISELLQRNQSFVEKSQVLMEQRNEGLLSSANQTQHRVLSLEQEKVELTKQLSEATSQISAFQLELSSMKKKEFELSQQLESGSKSTRQQLEELETLKSQQTESEGLITTLQKQLKDERHNRKSVEGNLSQVQEEISDLEEAKRALEKSLSDRKRKSAEERRQLEDEMEDVKANLEAEVQSLKEKLRKQKTSANAASQEQISQLEEEIHKDWQAKCDRMVSLATEKHNRALQTVQEEKQELETEKEQLEKKLQSLRQGSSTSDQRVNELEEQVEQLTAWKDKYESLRNNATAMKERYEEQIEELETERDSLNEKLEASESQGGAASSGTSGGNLLEEVKKIMNTVYKEMRDAFEADEKYTGSEILAVILNSIKSTTLSLASRSKPQTDDADDAEESYEDDESDEEEEEDDNEESEEEEENDDDGDTVEPISEIKITAEENVAETSKEKDVNEKPAVTFAEKDEEMSDSDGGTNETETTKTPEIPAESKSDEPAESVNESKEDSVEVVKESETKPEEETSQNTQNSDSTEQQEPVISNPLADTTSMKKASSLEDLLDSALESKPNKSKDLPAVPVVSMEPPPMSEGSSDEIDSMKERTKSIFGEDGDDDEDILGISSKPAVNGDTVKTPAENQSTADEDLKPKPPPPLFGDDDDDDDLDWLS